MKTVLLGVIYFFAYMCSMQAQTLYVGTTNGGDHATGTINKFVTATSDLTVARSFETVPASAFYTHLIQLPGGKLYGIGLSTIFSFDPATSAYTTVQELAGINGSNAYGSLIQASDGKLYGMTSKGGSNGFGVIFSYDPSSSTYIKLKDFDSTNGANPYGDLLQASDGKFYGMTNAGGSSGDGVVFSFDPVSAVYTKLMDFDSTNGANPFGSLMQAASGKLYAMTNKGGSNNVGVIFSFDPVSSAYMKLKDFDPNADGGNPYASLMQASDGKLYGMTNGSGGNNGGSIFSLDTSNSTFVNLKVLDYTIGSNPYGNLIRATDGKLYGMTAIGSNSIGDPGRTGVIFSFDISSSVYTKLRQFDDSTGDYPLGSLMQALDGKLYGVTNAGGGSNGGVIFSFDPPASNLYTKLKDITSNEEGSVIQGSLLRATDGKLYGVTNKGGSSGVGVIFSFDPSTSVYTKLKDFDNNSGAAPLSGLIQASDGKLYGMTLNGGNNNLGVVFSYDPASSTYTKLVDFDNTNGANPTYGLMQASNGKLYGMTGSGGSNGIGVIFSFDPSSSTYTKLRDFSTDDGGSGGIGGLMQASDGKLYGIAGLGPTSVIFSFDPSSTTYTVLKSFGNSVNLQGTLIQATDGKLYGMTIFGGGGCNCGTIYSFDPSSSAYTEIKDFDMISGQYPYGSLLQATDGKLYGTTLSGGSEEKGNVFSLDPASLTFTSLADFNGANGANPPVTSALIEVPEGPLPVTIISFTGKNIGNNNQLSWKVGNEQNLNYYELQRSGDGQNFKAISQIKAAGNNSYSYSDPIAATAPSLYYYRLKSVDKDGRFTFSIVIKITTDSKGFVTANPNPFRDKLTITIESLTQQKVVFILHDLNGKQLYNDSKILSPGSNIVGINETKILSKGTYLLTIIESQQTQTIKVVKGD